MHRRQPAVLLHRRALPRRRPAAPRARRHHLDPLRARHRRDRHHVRDGRGDRRRCRRRRHVGIPLPRRARLHRVLPALMPRLLDRPPQDAAHARRHGDLVRIAHPHGVHRHRDGVGHAPPPLVRADDGGAVGVRHRRQPVRIRGFPHARLRRRGVPRPCRRPHQAPPPLLRHRRRPAPYGDAQRDPRILRHRRGDTPVRGLLDAHRQDAPGLPHTQLRVRVHDVLAPRMPPRDGRPRRAVLQAPFPSAPPRSTSTSSSPRPPISRRSPPPRT